MTTPIKLYLPILMFALTLGSCSDFNKYRGDRKIFHAGPSSGGIGALYFGLYNDNTYQICNSGGLGEDCYSDNFQLDKDTLTLLHLSKKIPLKSNRLLVIRYTEQDSSFWKWKYAKSIGVSTWQDFKYRDSVMGGTGDVYQLSERNELITDELHFTIRLDSIKNYR